MKVLLYYLILFLSMIVLINRINPELMMQVKQLVIAPCSQPINYKVGNIDPKFNVSENEFLNDVEQAVTVWNRAEGKSLFKYDTNAKLNINLVYDDRQSLISRVNQIEDKLKEDRNQIQPTEKKYQDMVADFNQRLAELNKEIDYWNQNGGAPEEQYNNLKRKQEDLKKEAENLNQMAKLLNLSADNYNSQVDHLRQTASNLNDAIQNRPEEGIYDPNLNKIDIYLNVNKSELVHTLTHELGHALGLAHNNDPDSIMYPYTTKTITPTQEDLQSLKLICKG